MGPLLTALLKPGSKILLSGARRYSNNSAPIINPSVTIEEIMPLLNTKFRKTTPISQDAADDVLQTLKAGFPLGRTKGLAEKDALYNVAKKFHPKSNVTNPDVTIILKALTDKTKKPAEFPLFNAIKKEVPNFKSTMSEKELALYLKNYDKPLRELEKITGRNKVTLQTINNVVQPGGVVNLNLKNKLENIVGTNVNFNKYSGPEILKKKYKGDVNAPNTAASYQIPKRTKLLDESINTSNKVLTTAKKTFPKDLIQRENFMGPVQKSRTVRGHGMGQEFFSKNLTTMSDKQVKKMFNLNSKDYTAIKNFTLAEENSGAYLRAAQKIKDNPSLANKINAIEKMRDPQFITSSTQNALHRKIEPRLNEAYFKKQTANKKGNFNFSNKLQTEIETYDAILKEARIPSFVWDDAAGQLKYYGAFPESTSKFANLAKGIQGTTPKGFFNNPKFKEGGRVQLKTGGRVYLAPGGKVYQPTSSSGNSRVGMFESILSGIGAGILDIPKGAFSLGASLIDLGAGTDTAADIEMWFDDLTTLDERAEATTAGKITRIMTNLGIPGTAAFKAGSRMARSAMEAKEAGTLYKFTKNTEGALEKTLTNKGRMRQTLGGVAGVGVSDAIFVGDAERIGTLGDAFNIGPTQLADNDENNAARSVMNRVKFGLDSAFLGGIIGGTGTAIKQAVQRSNNLNRNNDLIDKLLEYTTPQGKKTKEFFEMEREMIGRRSADANKAQELQRQLDKEIDALYGQMGQKFGIGVQKERTALTKVVNDALVSSADGPKVTPIVNAEGLTEGATFTLGNMTPESLSALSKAKLKNPEEVVRILQRARRTMDKSFTDIASNVFRFGKSTKEAADDTLNRFAKFKTAFETKSLDYIDDTYRIFGNKNSEALKGFKPTAEAVTSAKEMFKQLALKRTGKTISDEQAAYEVERILVSSKKQNKFLVEGEAVPLLQDETGFLKDIAIKDWTKPMLPLNKVAGEAGEDILVNGLTPRKIIEDLFGKVEDPSATILSTLSDLSLVRRKHEFFGDFYDTMAGKQMFNTRREAAAVFGDNNVGEKAIQMLSTNPGGKLNIEAVNPLNGRWSSKGIQEALEEVNSGWTTVLDKDNVFTTFYNNFVLYPKATSQLAKTVLSPVTHFRNLISATAFASANGIMPLMNKEALDEAMGAFSQVGARGSEAANKRYRELLRLGVVNKNARLGDLEDLLDDVDFGTTKFTNKVMQNLGKKLNKGKEYATDLYTAEDDFWKMYTFAAERKRIKTALEKSGIDANVFARSADNDLGLVFKNGEEYLDEAAANVVRNNVPNYDYVSKFIKDLRKAPIGNFVSFPAEIIRTSINILGKGFKEFNYVDPITKTKPFRSIGMQRMAGFGATAVAIPYGTVEAFKAAYNVSGMEMDALRRFVPDWSKNSTLVPIKDDDGNFTYIDFSHANAYDTMIRPFKTIMNAVADGRTDNDTVMEDLMQGVVESTTELGSPFISESIWTQALTDVFVRNGRTRDGRRLYTEQTPYGDRFAKGLFHLVEAQTPGSASTIGRLFNSIFEKPDKYGKQYDFTKEAAGIAGLRAVEINPVETMKYKIADYRTGINNSRREFTSPLLKGGVVTPEQIIDRYKLANESLYQVQKNMTKDFYGAMILGANEDSLKREFKDRVSNKALRGIIQGQFKPFIPSENIEKSFRDQARELGNNSPFARAKDTIRRLAAEYSKLKLFGDRLPDFTNPFAGENTVLSTEGITSRLPSLNLGLNSLGGSATNNTSLTQAKGSKVFGSNDTVFGS